MVEDYHEDSLILVEDNGSIIVKTKFPQGEWLLGMILSYGSTVEVLSPASLRKKILSKINTIASLYTKK
jgi:predicted DNA-binding transcriptional regulator YafY